VYRFCDNVWTFVLNNVEFRELPDTIKVDKVKVVACDGRGTVYLHHLECCMFIFNI
jgi:transcription initiation factor TFIIA small subunit